MTTLPNTPSELIRVALADLRKVEVDERYKVDMGWWHKIDGAAPCSVCLAGAVMAKTLEVPITSDIHPRVFGQEITDRLYALGYFRTGTVNMGFYRLDIHRPPHIPEAVTIPEYADGREPFHAAMNEMANQLKKAGY